MNRNISLYLGAQVDYSSFMTLVTVGCNSYSAFTRLPKCVNRTPHIVRCRHFLPLSIVQSQDTELLQHCRAQLYFSSRQLKKRRAAAIDLRSPTGYWSKPLQNTFFFFFFLSKLKESANDGQTHQRDGHSITHMSSQPPLRKRGTSYFFYTDANRKEVPTLHRKGGR